IKPIAAILPQSPVVDSSVITDVPRLHIQTDVPTEFEDSDPVTPVEHSRARKGMFLRMKKLGLKMKQILFNRHRISRQATTNVVETEDNLDVLDIRGDSNVSQILPQLELQFGGMGRDERPAQPLAIQNRMRRQRPSLTPETYTPTNDSDPSQLDNPRQSTSQSHSERTRQASQTHTATVETASPDFRFAARSPRTPKTVDEIKPGGHSLFPDFSFPVISSQAVHPFRQLIDDRPVCLFSRYMEVRPPFAFTGIWEADLLLREDGPEQLLVGDINFWFQYGL
ncbi:hypothetical protein MPER_01699, partial [Moniliophthora perniciosa FA553]